MKEKTTQELLQNLLSRLNLDEANPLSKVYRSWESIVGSELAHNTKLVDIKGKVLIVKTNHPTFGSMLQMKKRVIIENINKTYPELQINNIQIRISSQK